MTPAPPLLHMSSATDVEQAASTHRLTTTQVHALHERARASKALAHCPYSNFRVGATILTRDGVLVDGANVENASSPVGSCAEVTAMSRAVVEGHRDFVAVGVATDVTPPTSPCGKCRQFMLEFCALETPVFMFDVNDDFSVMTLDQLLPYAFGPSSRPPRAR